MHYGCAGGGATRLELSDLDRQEHRKTYRLANMKRLLSWFRQPELVIKLEGGDVAGNAAAVLAALKELGLLELDRHRVAPGETVEEIYKDKLDLPFASAALKKLAGDLNRADFNARTLKPGEKLLYPEVSFDDYEFSVKLDTRHEGDQQRLKELLGSASGLLTNQKVEEETGVTKLTFKGYELRVPLGSEAQAARLREMLKAIPAEHLLIFSVDPTARGSAPLYATPDTGGTEEAADKFMKTVRETLAQRRPLPNNIQGFLGSLAGLKRTHPDLKACTRGAACPEIVLVDTPVELHPDIALAIKAGGNNTPGRKEIVAGDSQFFELGSLDEDVDHGTYMAGIIASQDNGYGLIGIHPAARITSADWLRLQNDHEALALMIERRDELPAKQIYVFASAWRWDNPLASEFDLLSSNLISRKIRDLAPLWIVAAGQDDTGAGQNITRQFPRGPMNLGFLPNVLVVTAYRLDPTGVPRLLPDANYSTEGMVHIAAPGKDIPSTISVSRYATGDGTSPATAFVAGVASAMVSTSDYYDRVERVKFRLQLTATPSLPPDAAPKVATGVLDPYLALLDPTKAWMKNAGGDYVEASPAQWCAPTLKVVDRLGAPVADGNNVETGLIYRLYRVGNTNEWVVYTKVKVAMDKTLPGVVRRIGPGRLVLNGPVGPTSAIFGGADGATYTPAAFGDLLLSQGLPSGVCR